MPEERQAAAVSASDLTPLDPGQVWVLRIRLGIAFLILLAMVIPFDQSVARQWPIPAGLLSALLFLVGLPALILLPRRHYRSWGYAEREDELHIHHGLWTRIQTAVPFARVQHIDVAQGPVERRFGLARLILHTAGTRSAAIPLPGLVHSQAEAMRDRIRAKIIQDLE